MKLIHAALVVVLCAVFAPFAMGQFADPFGAPPAPASTSSGGGPGSDTTAFHQDGDAFGAAATVGTNDANTLSLETGGVARWTLSATTSALQCTADGTAGAPVVTRSTDTDTGLYFPTVDQFAVTVGGAAKTTWAAASQVNTVPINGSAGSAASPSFGFSGDPGNGFYSAGVDEIGMSINGAEAIRFTSAGGIGVGVASPGQLVEIQKNQDAVTALRVTNTNADNVGNGTAHAILEAFDGTKSINIVAWPKGHASPALADSGGVSTSKPGGLVFNLLDNVGADYRWVKTDAATSTEQMRLLRANGNLGINNTGPTDKLTVTGNIQAQRGALIGSSFTGAAMAVGSTGGSQIAFTSAGATGDYLQFVTHRNGVAHAIRATIDVDGNLGLGTETPGNKLVVALDGTAATPSIALGTTADPNTGFYHPGADQLAVTTGGTARTTWSTTAQTNTVPLLESAGDATAPSVAFSGDTNTGLYSVGADVLGISAGGAVVAKATTTGLTTGADVAYISGAGAAPVTTYAWDALSDGVSFLPHFDSTTSVATSSAVGYNVTFGEGVVVGGPTNTSGLILAAPSATASLVYAVDHATGNDVQLQIKGTTVDLALSGAAPKVLINSVAASGTCTLDGAATATCTATVPTGTTCACSDTQPATNGVAAIACANSAGTLTATSSVTLDGSIVSYVCL
jgi:hypothetical protein